MNTLVIVESPAKAKTIEKYLGVGYRVKASVGHVRDLPKSNKDAVDVEGGFIPHYVVSSGKEHIIAELRKEAKKAETVLLATDPDREGEAIAWHIAELIKKDNKNIKRIVFHEITESAIKKAIEHPRAIDQHLREAQEARRVLDRLVGYDLSGLIWKKVRYGLSAGRVQSPALRILMEREREIRAFKPEDFWVITAMTETKERSALALICVEEPRDEAVAKDIVARGEKGSWVVTDMKETAQKRAPRPPFTTSTLQQTASTRLGFSPSRTMGAAQKLYEAGHITYMRTDSTSMSDIAQKEIVALVRQEYGETYIQPRTYKTKSKSAQEAHEAIRPTHFVKSAVGATDDQKQLYRLIFERTVASQMADAELKRTKITANITPERNEAKIPDFTTNGSRVTFDGWLKIDYRARGEDIEVPKVSASDPLTLLSIDSIAKQTQPPSRYSEAGLIKELEKRGIGRPSTYASIIKTIVDREYVIKEGRTLIPTDTGDVVSSFLEDNFADYISDTFTSEMEDELDEIALGTRDYEKTLKDFYTPFTKVLVSKEHIEKLTTLGEGPKGFPCPKCGNDMTIKLGRGGKFLSCSCFPDCDGARMIDGSETSGTVPIGIHPDTGENIYVLTGRFGPYVQLGETPKKTKKQRLKTKKVTKKKLTAKTKGTLEEKEEKVSPKTVAKKDVAPRRSSIPKEKRPDEVTVTDAIHYLSLPRILGQHSETGNDIIASIGRFGPFIVHDGDFRSLKGADSPYNITLKRAQEILKEVKKERKGEKVVKELGPHPKTRKPVRVFESKSGKFLRRGFKRISLPDNLNLETFTLEDALDLMK
jgi:DNA topoisomerase-1